MKPLSLSLSLSLPPRHFHPSLFIIRSFVRSFVRSIDRLTDSSSFSHSFRSVSLFLPIVELFSPRPPRAPYPSIPRVTRSSERARIYRSFARSSVVPFDMQIGASANFLRPPQSVRPSVRPRPSPAPIFPHSRPHLKCCRCARVSLPLEAVTHHNAQSSCRHGPSNECERLLWVRYYGWPRQSRGTAYL